MRRPPDTKQQKARVRVTDETRAKLSERSRDWWIRHRGAMSEHMESRKSPITSELKSLASRIASREEDKKAIAADIKEIYASAKSYGFDTKVLARLVKRLGMDAKKRSEAQEQDDLFDTYMVAVGIAGAAGNAPAAVPPFVAVEREAGTESRTVPASIDSPSERVSRAVSKAEAAGMGGASEVGVA